jgi:hypothetical protein
MTDGVAVTAAYLAGLARIRGTGAARKETSYALFGIRGAERPEGWLRREDAWVVEARW